MSLVESTLLSLVRALVVAGITLLGLLLAGRGIRGIRAKGRDAIFWATMAVLLLPGLASGFVHFSTAMRLPPWGREAYYCLLVWARYAPLAVLTIWLMPPAISAEGMHCFRLSAGVGHVSVWRRWWWELRAWGVGLWLGVGLVFLLTFQEFELATTWNMRAWTVGVFDAQAGGMALGASVQLVLVPLAVQLGLMAILALGLRRQRGLGLAGETSARKGRGPRQLLAAVPILGGLALHGWLPFLLLAYLPYAAWAEGFHTLGLAPWREIGNGLGLTLAALTGAWFGAGWVVRRGGWRWVCILPGLLGPLLCSLTLQSLVQAAPFSLARGTVLLPVLGLLLVLLPPAALLRFGLETTRDIAAQHVARQAEARRPLWQLETWPRLCALGLLLGFGYGDFTINSLLAPPTFTSASVRLLNLLHYGRSEVLFTMFAVAFAAPLVLALLTALAARFYARHRGS